jgi:uncharacterized protein HemX
MGFISGLLGKFKMQIIAIVSVLILVGLAYGYWNYSQNKIATLIEQNSALKMANQTNEETIKKMQQNFADAQKKLTDLNKQYESINKDTETTKQDVTVTKLDKTNKDQVAKKVTDAMNGIFQSLNAETNQDTF